jgi:hypothetical protein
LPNILKIEAVPPFGGAAFVAYWVREDHEMAEKNQKGSKGSSGKNRSSSESSGRGSRSRNSRDTKSKGSKKQYSATTRDVERQRQAERMERTKKRGDLKGAAVNLPNWIVEEVERSTPGDRVGPTLEALGAASEALGDGNFHSAVKHGLRAKSLAPQSATIRETIGLAAYRLGDWSTALKELRAYRRMAGETTHLPIEMDVLRAQGRDKDVEMAWEELEKRGGHGLVMNEGRIVYASYLLDQDRPDEAWKVIKPPRMEQRPNDGHLRLYYVAARAAAARGDKETARSLSDEIVTHDPAFPGYEQLEREIAAIG